MLHLRALLFYTCMIVITIIYAPITLLLYPFSYSTRYRFINTWIRFNLWTAKVLCGLHFTVEGVENIPEGPAIIFCKHQSVWETFAVQVIFPPQSWILKRELLRIPFFGWGLATMRPVAIDRSAGRSAVDQLVEQGIERLQEGKWITLYPEGTRIAPGQRGRYKMGGAVLAEKSGYPVVPMAHNAGVFWPKNSFIKYPGTISVVVGPVIESEGRKAAEIMALVEDWIETTIADLPGPTPPNSD